MLKRLVFAVLMFGLMSIPVLAQVEPDSTELPNDPRVNDAANACYEGGSLAFRCFTELHWEAGWYLIRFEAGLISRADFPKLLAWVLPPEVIVENTSKPGGPVAPSTCAFAWNPNFYVDFSSSNFVGSGNYWSDPDCTVPNGNLTRKWVFSPSGQANATNICVANLGAGFVATPSHGPLVFECVI
jgi:hypothetical protein